MSRYGIHPMEEHYQNWESERREKRDRYWQMLYAARADFMKMMNESDDQHQSTDPGALFYYLQQNYGLKIELIDGKITSNYTIVDEKKYSMFLLKYA